MISWEDKAKMVRLSNIIDDEKSRTEFNKFVLEKIGDFDDQSYEILISCLQITEMVMKENIEFTKEVYRLSKGYNIDKLGFRESLRWVMYHTICEEQLNIKL